MSARPILGLARGISIGKRDGQLLGERANELIERVELIGSQGLRRREIQARGPMVDIGNAARDLGIEEVREDGRPCDQGFA